MAVAGTVVAAWTANGQAYASVLVAEGGSAGNVEYVGSTPLVDAQGVAKSAAVVKADLVAAVKAVRDAQQGTRAPLPGVSGAVNL